MKTIEIRSLKLTNFKGIRSLELKELSKDTFIYGDNATGKTTLFDAFTWLLFGKDSTDRKDFEIKTLNSKNQVIPKIDHEVEAVIEVNGERIELRRIFREKWVKRRGALDAEFAGNETLYEWNGVPMLANEYMSKIDRIVDEKVFKMITNPAAFNALKWQDQRDVLIDMTGNITDEEVAAGDSDFEALLSKLTGKSLEEYSKQIKASISKSKQEIKMIPTRIDEVERAKPEPQDFDALRKGLEKKEAELNAINDQITDELKAQQAIIDRKTELKKEIQKLDFQISDIKHEYQVQARETFRKQSSGDNDIERQIVEKKSQIETANNGLVTLNAKLKSKKEELTRISEEIVGLRTKWEAVNSEDISVDHVEDSCPTCKQKLPEEDIENRILEMVEKLKVSKQKRLDDIQSSGKSLKATMESLSIERDDLQERIKNGTAHIETLRSDLEKLMSQFSRPTEELPSELDIYNNLLASDTKIKPIQVQVQKLAEELDSTAGVDVSELKDKRDTLKTDVQYLELQLANEKEIEKHNKRIEELSKEEGNLAQAIADLEKEQYVIEAFEKEKSTRIEQSVNNRFSLVNFKLFETQINGGEVPTCKALINGVPFSDANTASKINAGLDIINTLCGHYGANAPIFIDNRESVVELIPTGSQVINLVVSEADKKLRVVSLNEKLQTV